MTECDSGEGGQHRIAPLGSTDLRLPTAWGIQMLQEQPWLIGDGTEMKRNPGEELGLLPVSPAEDRGHGWLTGCAMPA